MSTYRFSKLFDPRSIALVGGSDRSHSVGAAVLRNIKEGGYGGAFAVVNPAHSIVGGQPAYRSLADIPFVPELIVVAAPSLAVPAILNEAAELGVAAAVVITAESSANREAMEASLQALRHKGLRLVGPNCLGIILPARRVNASFAARMPLAGNLALISQSGAIVAAMIDWASRRSIGFSGIVSIGNQRDVDVADCLDFFTSDPHTSAILLYIEAITDARKFMSAARAAARVKPVVVIKAGRHPAGAKAAATHTGALAGADAVYDVAFRRIGLLRVFDLRGLFDCAAALAMKKSVAAGRRLAMLTNGGGLGVLAADRLAEYGGELAVIGRRRRPACVRP